MAKTTSESLQVVILQAVARFPDSASVDEIGVALDHTVPRRTLQRRIALLVFENRLIPESEGRGRRYRLPPPEREAVTSKPVTGGIRYSPEAEAIRDRVALPISSRKPVGYDRAFLDQYRPNESFYLTTEIRAYLASLGAVPDVRFPPGTYVRQVLNRLLIDLSWNSSRLEGNTYSLLETERLLEFGENAEGRNVREAQMILNHKAAIELLVEAGSDIGFNRYTICNLHALLSENLLSDPQACGRVRLKGVGITGTVFQPLHGPQVIDECFEQVLHTADAVENVFEKAFFVMVHLPYLQPIEDVNKRVSRLAANIPLIRANFCPLSFVDVPEQDYTHGILGVYELTRVELLRDVFVWAYERSCARYSAVRQSLGEPDPFRLRYRQELADMVAAVVRGQLDKKAAGSLIQHLAFEKAEGGDRSRLVEVAETELMALHEGNIARYRLRLSEYQVWHATWH
jgi:hypothetical protein